MTEVKMVMSKNDNNEMNSRSHNSELPESDLPSGLASPARRALAGAGYQRLEQFSKLTKAEVLQLHGMGPKAMNQMSQALAAKGLTFADGL
ncbi:DNA-binding protein [Paenibacillus solisilvae]|uniref:DNA-binding protein n=1 Tax=Paenibacillus solisilvae TaxID=2486751 RepID=A0ABW0W8H0_9BACL